MEKIIVDLEAKTDKAIKGIENVAKEVQDLNKSVVETNKDTAKSLKSVEKSSKSASKGIRAIGASLKAAGIGLAIAALSTMKDLFSQNQKVVDFFNIAFETTAQVIGSVVTAFVNTGEELTKSTDKLDAFGKVMGGLLDLVVKPLEFAFYGIKLAIQEAMLAWEQSFFGDKDQDTINELNLSILETKTNIVETGEAIGKAGKDVVDNWSEAVDEVVDGSKVLSEELSKVSVKAALETAKVNNEIQKSAEVAAARQGLIFEKFDRQAEKLRQFRDDERNSIAERKKANDELLIEIDKAEKASLKQAKSQLAIANANLAKDKDNIEFKVAQIEAQRELAAVEAQFEGIRSEQKSNDLALSKEQLEIDKSKLESKSKLSIEQKKFDAEQIDNALLRLEKLKELDKLEQEQETARLQALVDNTQAGTQAKVDAQIALDEFKEQSRQTNITRDKEIADEEEKINQNRIKNQTAVVDAFSQLADAETGIGQALLIAKQALALKESIIDLKRITFKGTQAIGEAGVDAASNVSSSSKIGFPQNLITIAAAIGQGVSLISSVKKAVSKTKAQASGIATSTPTAPSVSTPASQPPAFNIVGGGATNQLAEAIGNQANTPIKTYVVANDVTTSQSLDRNIVDGASL